MPDGPLSDRVALVTGAGRAETIGAAVARRLAADGARVVLHSWGEDATEVLGGIPGAVHVAADFADPEAPAAVVAAAREAFGRLDILVAAHARSSSVPLEALTAEEIDVTYAVNTRATLLLVRELAAAHDGAAGGRVVFFTSGQYHGAMPGELPYIASKGALHQLTRSLAVHLAPRGITVNCIDPGPNDTGYADERLLAEVAAASPSGRWGRPLDAARMVAWLAGDEADWVTGQVIASDGGWSAR
jgi:3-oxoacyl-[acyl-carrier protein] reductase